MAPGPNIKARAEQHVEIWPEQKVQAREEAGLCLWWCVRVFFLSFLAVVVLCN